MEQISPELRASVISILDEIAKTRLLVIGDVMLDVYLDGTARRISPEAPVPVVDFRDRFHVPGGAANAAVNAMRLGGQVKLFGVTGQDQSATELIQSLVSLQDAAVIAESTRVTTTKTRIVCDGQHMLRIDHEDRQPLLAETRQMLKTAIESSFDECDCVLLSDYDKGVFDEDLQVLITTARNQGLPVVLDSKCLQVRSFEGVSLVTPNDAELMRAGSADQLLKAGAQAVLHTRGAAGMSLYRPKKKRLDLAARRRDVTDVSGAGDTVAASIALALGAGLDLPLAVELANVAAGIAVSKFGTAFVRPDEVLAEIFVAGSSQKIVMARHAEMHAMVWRELGKQVGFTNGCFDLIHPGHIELLKRARASCDRLIVGLNSDASVRRLKGPDRPLQDEASRAAVLAAMECVDHIVIFNEDTPYELIKRVKPDVLVKGGDYGPDEIVGADLVRDWGGRVEIVELVGGHSSTALIKTARSQG